MGDEINLVEDRQKLLGPKECVQLVVGSSKWRPRITNLNDNIDFMLDLLHLAHRLGHMTRKEVERAGHLWVVVRG